MAARDRRRFGLAEPVELVGCGAKDVAGLLRLAERLERQTELKEREGMTFGKMVAFSNGYGFAQGGGACREMLR